MNPIIAWAIIGLALAIVTLSMMLQEKRQRWLPPRNTPDWDFDPDPQTPNQQSADDLDALARATGILREHHHNQTPTYHLTSPDEQLEEAA